MRRLFASCFLLVGLMTLTALSQPGVVPKDKKDDKAKGPPRYVLGKIFPPPVRAELNLTAEQAKQIEALEAEVADRLKKILTEDQLKRIDGGAGRPEPELKGPEPKGKDGNLKLDTTSKPAFGGKENPAPATPEGLKHLAGRWYLKEGKTNVYLYRDADKFVDLFSETGDSNKDGTPDLKVKHDEKCIILESQNLPNHPTAKFPNTGNPNKIAVQKFTFRIPMVPKPADKITPPSMGPIGVAINGVVFFNPFEAGSMNAVAGYSETWFDSCCGHPQQEGVYHYHKYPSCVKTPFPDDGKAHSPVIGFAWDGYPVYGPYVSDGVQAKDLKGADALDVCNGRFDPDRGYHYHATPGKFPYMIGGYAGVVEPSNTRGARGAGAVMDNTTGAAREWGISTLKPGTADRGKNHKIQIELGGRDRIPAGIPSRVVIGPFEGAKITRDANTILCEITIPKDANRGALHDCHIEWDGRTPTVVKKNTVFRVGGE